MLPFITPELSYRLEQCSAWRSVNYVQAYQRLHPEAQTAILHVGGGVCAYVGPGSPLNSASGLGFDLAVREGAAQAAAAPAATGSAAQPAAGAPETTQGTDPAQSTAPAQVMMPAQSPAPFTRQDLEAVEDFYRSRGAPVRLSASPLAGEEYHALLRENGYRLEGFFSVLARPIPADYRPAPLPEGLTIALARPDEAERWIAVTGQGFGEEETPSPAVVDILGPNFHAAEGAPYFARIQGELAGGGGMYYHAGVVELGGASTRPAFRRRGVQRALIEARLAHARVLGCDLALVLTEPGSASQKNVERAGFSLAYTKVKLVKA